MTYELTPQDRDALSDYPDQEESFEHGRSIALEGFTTTEILTELKKRYRKKMVILDYIEMIECEL